MLKKIYPQSPAKRFFPPVFSANALKWLAVITMFIDHVGAVFIEKGVISAYNQHLPTALSYDASLFLSKMDRVLRQVGRISFPIFCFLLVEGFYHTSNRFKYAKRLFLFTLLSEIPFDLCFRGKLVDFSYQNVMLTLFLGLLVIWAADTLRQKKPALLLLPAAAGLVLGWLCHADYDWKGILLIFVFYLFYAYPAERTIAGCLSLLWEPMACLSFIPINMYNHQKGGGKKYFFYFFYPVHLLILFFIRRLVFHI